MNFKNYIRNIPDFPKKGIMFKDITPLLQDKNALKNVVKSMEEQIKELDFKYIIGIEARGFLIGTPLALSLNKGFIPIRKAGKLPADKLSASYELEYGTNELEIHCDAIDEGDKVVLVDDLLATGGTSKAAIELIEELGGEIVAISYLIELKELEGRKILKDYDIFTLIEE